MQLPLIVPFDSDARLDTFLWEPSQQPLRQLCEQPATTPPAFFWLWGKPAVGKTHLLQGIAQREPEAIYLPASHLLEYEPASLQALHESRLLLIDDVDRLVSAAWEEALFCLCQALLQSGAQLWLSATMPPAQAPFALRDLVSRLQLALVYEVQELSEEAKMEAFTARARRRGIELRDDAVQFILSRNQRSLHDLMALLDRLDVQALAEQRRITIPFIKATLGW